MTFVFLVVLSCFVRMGDFLKFLLISVPVVIFKEEHSLGAGELSGTLFVSD